MLSLICAIERFERALRSDDVTELEEAEQACWLELGNHIDQYAHETICEERARGCTEGVFYRGTLFAQGYGPDGRPAVILMRRVTELDSPVHTLTLADVRGSRLDSGSLRF